MAERWRDIGETGNILHYFEDIFPSRTSYGVSIIVALAEDSLYT